MNLTKRQQDAMKKHSAHHTSKHMKEMKKSMLAGKTFTQAHKIAMKKVGTKWVFQKGITALKTVN